MIASTWFGSVFLFLVSSVPAGWHAGPGTEVADDGVVTITGRSGTLDVTLPANTDTLFGLGLEQPSATGTITLRVGDDDRAKIGLRRDREGNVLTVQPMAKNPESGRWEIIRSEVRTLTYRPPQSEKLIWANLRDEKLPEPDGWRDRRLQLRAMRVGESASLTLDGCLLWTEAVSLTAETALRFEAPAGDRIELLHRDSCDLEARFQPLDIRGFAAGDAGRDAVVVEGGVPFLRPEGRGIDLRQTRWPFVAQFPSSYNAPYDFGPAWLHDPRTPVLEGPCADLKAIHFLVRPLPVEDGESGREFSVRLGSFGGRSQVLYHDYHVEIPPGTEPVCVTLPVTELIAQDMEPLQMRPILQVALNKPVHLLRRRPDPSRYQIRPVGLAPGAEVLGVTYEVAAVQVRLRCDEPGHVFSGTKSPVFQADLTNNTAAPQDCRVRWTARPQTGEALAGEAIVTLEPLGRTTVPIRIDCPTWGHYDLELYLQPGADAEQRRTSSFALLPEDTRQHREHSPFGTWTFCGGHATCDDPEVLGELLHRAGLRFGMSRFPVERARWGILNNFEPKAIDKPEKYRAWVAAQKGPYLPAALLLHEHSVSREHATRVPDILSGGEPYRLSPPEQQRFDALWEDQMRMAKLMRADFPDVHLRLGNGPLPTKEEFYRRGFPAELFDSGGNEAASFGRLPEAQPPDWIANNASLWMDRKLLDSYGYEDKPVTQCYEITFPCTNPGNLVPLEQAAYFVRHALHSLAWRIPEIRFGCLEDVGSSYRFSNWGAAGLMHAWPHMNPKPAYVAVAVMTQMLDGATFVKSLDTGSDTLYAAEFSRVDGRTVVAVWTVRGERSLEIEVEGSDWTLTDWQGNAEPAAAGKRIALRATPMPAYLAGSGGIGVVVPGDPRHETRPSDTAVLVARLDSLEGWTPLAERDSVLDSYNPLTPRRFGQFDFSVAPASTAAGAAILVRAEPTDGPETVPVYGALVATEPLALPGVPSEIGLWVDGNSGWGRLIYELVDASGQTWTSIGAAANDEPSEWMLDWLPAEFTAAGNGSARRADWNTNDVFGASVICFDGWRYVRFPLPGNYPGEAAPWPANSQWRSDKDGIVHHPLSLRRIIIEMPLHVLKMTDFSPVADPALAFRQLHVEYGTQGNRKRGVLEGER
jgi:hypothetical protein